MYTSGTTGEYKGALLSNGNLTSEIISFCQELLIGEKTIIILPLYHILGLTISLLCSLYSGATIYISEGNEMFLHEIKSFQPDNLVLVPILVKKIYDEILMEVEKSGLGRILKYSKMRNNLWKITSRKKLQNISHKLLGNELKYIVTGGAPINPQLCYFFRRNKIELLNGYGATECSAAVSVNRMYDNRVGSVGKILKCNDVMVDNVDGNGVGEIFVKGTNVIESYDQDSTGFEYGYFRTGDIGKVEDGYLYITGRSKNMILLGNGQNVFPEELETKIKKIDYVDEVVVMEEDDKVKAEIYIKDEARRHLIYADINKMNSTLPVYKRIRSIEVRDNEFPKTKTGKIKRVVRG